MNPVDTAVYMEDLGRRARAASRLLARAASGRKNAALRATADRLRAATGALIDANRRDVGAARAAGQDAAFVDRLALNEKAIDHMATPPIVLSNTDTAKRTYA